MLFSGLHLCLPSCLSPSDFQTKIVMSSCYRWRIPVDILSSCRQLTGDGSLTWQYRKELMTPHSEKTMTLYMTVWTQWILVNTVMNHCVPNRQEISWAPDKLLSASQELHWIKVDMLLMTLQLYKDINFYQPGNLRLGLFGRTEII
jgi:hypothetical protein